MAREHSVRDSFALTDKRFSTSILYCTVRTNCVEYQGTVWILTTEYSYGLRWQDSTDALEIRNLSSYSIRSGLTAPKSDINTGGVLYIRYTSVQYSTTVQYESTVVQYIAEWSGVSRS